MKAIKLQKQIAMGKNPKVSTCGTNKPSSTNSSKNKGK